MRKKYTTRKQRQKHRLVPITRSGLKDFRQHMEQKRKQASNERTRELLQHVESEFLREVAQGVYGPVLDE